MYLTNRTMERVQRLEDTEELKEPGAHMSPGKGRRFGMSSCKSPCDFSVAGLSMSRYPMDDTGSAGDGQLGNAVGSTTACQCDSR